MTWIGKHIGSASSRRPGVSVLFINIYTAIICLLVATRTSQADSSEKIAEVTYVIEPFESKDDTWFNNGNVNNDNILNFTTLTGENSDDKELDILHGKGIFLLKYRPLNDATISFGSINRITEAPHNCIGATYLSLWYNVLSIPETINAYLRLVILDDSDCVGESCVDPPGMNLENYYSDEQVLNSDNNGGWQELRINLTDGFTLLPTGEVGNGELDLDRIRGWRIEISSSLVGGSVLENILEIYFDQLACVGDGNVFGSSFHITNSIDVAVKEGQWYLYEPIESEVSSDITLADGKLNFEYTVDQVKNWGGYIGMQHIAPGSAYYNLSQAVAVSLNYAVLNAASPEGRVHFRLMLLESSDCYVDCGYPGKNLENYYSFHYILDYVNKGNITVRLEGDNDESSPFWRTDWFGIVGNNKLDKSMIKGFQVLVSMNGDGDIGSSASGLFELGSITALSELGNNTPGGNETCKDEPDLTFTNLDEEASVFERLNYAGSKCCEICKSYPDCSFALQDGLLCYLAPHVPPDSVELLSDDRDDGDSKPIVFVMDNGGDDFCQRCECNERNRTIDCRNRDLVVIPGTFLPHFEGGDRRRKLSWTPRALDLRNNSRLVIIGSDSFASISGSLEELRLPKNLRYLAPENMKDLSRLTSVIFESDGVEENYEGLDTPNNNLLNVILGPTDRYGDVCCSRGEHIELTSPPNGLTFCYMDAWRVGSDAEYESYTEYNTLPSDRIARISPGSHFLSEAAKSSEYCAEYCHIVKGCEFFAYDARFSQAEHICHLLKGNITKLNVSDDFADENQTLPGWISGITPAKRHELNNARVFVMPTNLIANENNGWKVSFEVSLGETPHRGAVWIETKVASGTILNVSIVPQQAVLYNVTTTETINVEILNPNSLDSSQPLLLTNSIESCDDAYIYGANITEETSVVIDVIPKDSGSRKILVASIVPSILVVALVLLLLYNLHKKRQQDKLWSIQLDELEFDDPPEIIGRGTFGLVILAEYHGTNVAVKRVIPPRVDSSMRKATIFGLGDRLSSFASNTMSLRGTTKSQHAKVFKDVELGTVELASVPEEPSEKNLGVSTVAAPNGFTAYPISNGSTSIQKKRQQSIHDEYGKLKKEFVKEMRLLSKLRHPCITTIMGAVVARGEEPMLIMEYMDHGSLYDLLTNETMLIDGEHILPILRDITQGVRFLHASRPQIIHGDLKGRNILVDGKFRAKVADFGLTQKQRLGATGTPFWMAPELLRGESTNNAATDVYSFGIMLYEVYARKDPYEGEDFDDVLKRVKDPFINYRPPVPAACPKMIESMMKRCLDNDPENRPTFGELDVQLKEMNVKNVEPSETPYSMQKKEMQQTNSLLLDVFPRHIAESLRKGQKVEPESRDVVTIFFSDIVGFTNISSTLEPIKISDMLDRLYGKFDSLSREHDVFKVETIGDAYMAVTNLVKDQPKDHVSRIAKFSIDALKAANETLIDKDDPGKGCVNIRVGFHSGPVVANVVGSRNPRYCLFGDTVNTASRMESNSIKNRIHCTERSATLLQQQCSGIPILSRGLINVKGKGEMNTYWVNESAIKEM